MPTATATPGPTNTPTAVPTYTLSGTVFFDYNGDGLRDEGEPPIEGVHIRVAGLSTASGPGGTYSLAGMPAGRQQVSVESPTEEPATAFRYINSFLGWVDIPAYEMNGVSVPAQRLADADFQPIDQPLGVVLTNDQVLDIALTQGFLTLPFRTADLRLITLVQGFDHDPRMGYVANYAGDTRFGEAGEEGTFDSHPGWDYYCQIGTLIVAAADGRASGFERPTSEDSLNMGVEHGFHIGGGTQVMTVYGHLKTVLVQTGQEVYRGQVIASSGMTGRTTWPHLHLDLLFGQQNPPEPDDCLPVQYQKDPYGVLPGVEVNLPIERYSCWTVFNDPRTPF